MTTLLCIFAVNNEVDGGIVPLSEHYNITGNHAFACVSPPSGDSTQMDPNGPFTSALAVTAANPGVVRHDAMVGSMIAHRAGNMLLHPTRSTQRVRGIQSLNLSHHCDSRTGGREVSR